jgi:E3 ubiquitin-protein ligase TRIP12
MDSLTFYFYLTNAPLFVDGVFDHKSYTEKSLARMLKAKSKAERAATRQSQTATQTNAVPETVALSSAAQASVETLHEDVPSQEVSAAPTPDQEAGSPVALELPQTSEPSMDRTELLRSNMAVVNKFMRLMVPILVDVYAASVITPVRIRTLTGILKAVSFLEAGGLKQVLHVSCTCSCLSHADSLLQFSLYLLLALYLPSYLPATILP